MKLENQVCTLEQSKKLSEFGIIAKSLFYWREYLDESVNEWQTAILLENKTDDDCIKYALADASYPAFTVAELGILLGEFIQYWFCVKSDISEADARAEMLINLLTNKLLDVADCNFRLAA